MKKLMATIIMAFIAAIVFTGCKTTPLKDALGNTLTSQDIQTYGEVVGEAGYYAYAFYKNNPKHTKEVKRIEEIYAALEKAKAVGGREDLDLAAINDATCEIITLAATSYLGPTNGALVGAGSRAALLLGYQFYKSRVKEDNLEVYLNAVWTGVERAKKNGYDLIAVPTEIDELIAMEPTEECPINCLLDKVKSRIAAGGLTPYDKKRLEKRRDELQKIYDKTMADIAAEQEAERQNAAE